MPARGEFLAAIPPLRALVEAAGTRWNEDSALEGMTTGALAGHAARAVTLVRTYLEAPVGPSQQELVGEMYDAAGYFLSIPGLGDDLETDANRAVRRRAADEARTGPTAILAAVDESAQGLADVLARQQADRAIVVLGGRPMLLDEYLTTRLVEIVVHSDDLAASLGRPEPEFEPDATDRVVGCLIEMAARRHGSLAVIRAMTRRERDLVRALRVL